MSYAVISLIDEAQAAAARGFGLDVEPAPGQGRRGRVYVRRDFDIASFGVNAFYQADPGAALVNEHDEAAPRGSGHEELYVVLRGSCTFTVDGEEVDAPHGTALFVSDPATTRSAHANEDGTIVLVVGGRPGEALAASGFFRYYREGDDQAALAACWEALGLHPDNPAILYNTACVEMRLGHREAAVDALDAALAAAPEYRALVADDDDLAPLRDDERFRALAG